MYEGVAGDDLQECSITENITGWLPKRDTRTFCSGRAFRLKSGKLILSVALEVLVLPRRSKFQSLDVRQQEASIWGRSSVG